MKWINPQFFTRCVSAGSKFAISGGSDDSCKIYDMLERRELGTLQHHDVRCKITTYNIIVVIISSELCSNESPDAYQGIVTCVATQAPSHLITASDDNSLAILRMGSWQVKWTVV